VGGGIVSGGSVRLGRRQNIGPHHVGGGAPSRMIHHCRPLISSAVRLAAALLSPHSTALRTMATRPLRRSCDAVGKRKGLCAATVTPETQSRTNSRRSGGLPIRH